MGGFQYIATWTGMDSGRIQKIFKDQKFVSFELAEKILIAVGQEHALTDSRINVVPHPEISKEKWQKRMSTRGCEGDEFLFDH